MTAVAERFRRATGPSRGQKTKAMSALGKAGVAGRGSLYLAVAFLAARLAAGRYRAQPDKQGALEVLGAQPMGRVLVAALVAGFLAFALWNAGHALLAPGEEDKLSRRVRDGFRAVLYGTFFVAGLPYVLRRSGGSGGGDAEHDITARAVQSAGGRWLLGAVGVAVAVNGVLQAVRAARRRYDKTIERDAPAWVKRLAAIARFGRAGVFVLVGVFVCRVALRVDGPDSAGIDGALLRLAAEPAGRVLVAAAALGMALFGIHSILNARFGRVVESDST